MVQDFYTVLGNSVQYVYDFDENAIGITPNTIDVASFTNLHGLSAQGQSQGSCIDDDGNVYTILYGAGKIVKYNIYTKQETIYTFTPNAYGHANDAIYNPNTGYVYIASQNDTGEVYVLDPSNGMALVNTVYALKSDLTPIIPWNITYDRNTRKFILMHSGVIYQYNDGFTLYDSSKTYNRSEWAGTRQSIDTDGRYLYCLTFDPNKLHIFDLNGNFIMRIDCSALQGESEAIMYDWESGLFFVQNMYGVARIQVANIMRLYSAKEITALQLVS